MLPENPTGHRRDWMGKYESISIWMSYCVIGLIEKDFIMVRESWDSGKQNRPCEYLLFSSLKFTSCLLVIPINPIVIHLLVQYQHVCFNLVKFYLQLSVCHVCQSQLGYHVAMISVNCSVTEKCPKQKQWKSMGDLLWN